MINYYNNSRLATDLPNVGFFQRTNDNKVNQLKSIRIRIRIIIKKIIIIVIKIMTLIILINRNNNSNNNKKRDKN